jgi:hypothetical protein
MSPDARFTVLVTISLFILSGISAGVVYLVKGAQRWTKTESRLEDLVHQVEKLIANKSEEHRVILSTIRDDRQATDRRLRWLEENLWNKRGTVR